ncbi:macrophage mannose receptor 1-like [Tiliqua scincoides]|uniref:macrophage mannose receptor 1-like n=1 Tax=Tiliqua scincoides TaxID=71010 RepID=UPI003461EBED
MWMSFNMEERSREVSQRELPYWNFPFRPADTMMCSENWSVYEEIDPAAKREGKQIKPRSPAWKAPCTRKRVVVCGAAVLATSVFLNVLLIALGILYYSKMDSTLEQVSTENKLPQEKTVPSSFALYNEKHKLCVAVQQPNYLTAASCNLNSTAQLFQWVNRSLLRHMDSQLCVAAGTAMSKTALFLQPCNAGSPLQHWECRDGDLLALEGKKLYFNYGNNIKRVVMLYDRDGPWSRWLINGTRSNICRTACIPSAWDWILIQDSYYFLSRSPGTWDVANQSCTSMESHLVMISSTEEKGHIAEIMKASTCWIGLTDHMLDGDWKWVDGTRVGPDYKSYWRQGQPNGGKAENCGLMMKDSFWYDNPCTEAHHWICERKH